MKYWEDFYDEVMPGLPGDPGLPMVDNLIRNAAIELFDFSGAWKVDILNVVTEAGNPLVTLDYSNDTNICWVNSLRTDTGVVVESNATKLEQEFGGNWQIMTGPPNRYIQTGPDVLRIFPIPDAVYSLYPNASIKPTKDALGITDEMFNAYWSAIVDGALSRLMSQPKKPWTDAQLARDKKLDFEKAKGEARVDALKDFGNVSLSVAPVVFGGARRG